MELLILMHLSNIEKFPDVVSYLSVVMYVNFARAHTHTYHSEILVLNLGVFIRSYHFFGLVLVQLVLSYWKQWQYSISFFQVILISSWV
jgi:hypothetical protein